ncbi:MAG: ABC transporter permease [Allosphingosinicella sp.]
MTLVRHFGRIEAFGFATAGIAALLVAWALLPDFFGVSTFLVPRVDTVVIAFWRSRRAILVHGGITATAGLFAIASAILSALALACATALSSHIKAALTPLIVIGQALPKVVLIPFLFLILKDARLPGMIVGALIAFFPTYLTLQYSIETIPQGMLDLSEVWGYSRWRTLKEIAIPYAIPAAVSTIGLAWVYSLIGVLSAELLHPSRGLGFLLDQAQNRLDTETFFSVAIGCLVLALTGWILASMIDSAVRRRFRVSGQRTLFL